MTKSVTATTIPAINKYQPKFTFLVIYASCIKYNAANGFCQGGFYGK